MIDVIGCGGNKYNRLIAVEDNITQARLVGLPPARCSQQEAPDGEEKRILQEWSEE